MSCDRAHEIDAGAYLAEPGNAAFAAFREHFPTCTECSAAVGEWLALEERLRAGKAPAHPEPALIGRYQRAPGSLEQDERRMIEGHLESCRTCADEVSAGSEFDFSLLPPRPARSGDTLRKAAGTLRRALERLRAERAERGGGDLTLAAASRTVVFASAEAVGTPEGSQPRAQLRTHKEQAQPIFDGELRIGRAKSCEVTLPSPDLARVEAIIRASAEGLSIELINPRGSLQVNGIPVTQQALAAGDVIEFSGGIRLQLEPASPD